MSASTLRMPSLAIYNSIVNILSLCVSLSDEMSEPDSEPELVSLP